MDQSINQSINQSIMIQWQLKGLMYVPAKFSSSGCSSYAMNITLKCRWHIKTNDLEE